MKRIIAIALLLFGGVIFSTGYAQVNESFNTRPSVTNVNLIKAFLQDHCWELSGVDINLDGNASIEGDGSLDFPLHATEDNGLYSPMLQVPGNMYLQFSYRFSANVSAGHVLKIALTDFDNNVFMVLDYVDMSGDEANNTYHFSKYYNNLPSGDYRLSLNFVDGDGSTQMMMDELLINLPLLYNSGCNSAPVAANDVINGLSNHTAHGFIMLNDYDPNSEYFTPYLISNSPDGNVWLSPDGSFDFVPNAGFTGSTTSFTYQVCDRGYGPLCSNVATVTINFPGSTIPMKLIDFGASINDNWEVNLKWTTTFEQGTDRFEIERSLDGREFKKVGEVKGAGNSQIRTNYNYDDKLRNSTLDKNDVYYRLRLVNLDNKSELSKVLVIRLVNTSSTKTIAVTPNPTRNDINVQVQLRENSYVVMKVTDSKGAEVARKSTKGASGLNSFLIEGTSNLIPGVYMLEVIVNSSERMITRLIKN
jgi:methionine-rich copper-binding protein CopC